LCEAGFSETVKISSLIFMSWMADFP